MSIFIAPLAEPKVWTKDLKTLFEKATIKQLDYSLAYFESSTLLGMFSVKKHRALKQSKEDLRVATLRYYDLVKSSGQHLNAEKWAKDYRTSFNTQCPYSSLRIEED